MTKERVFEFFQRLKVEGKISLGMRLTVILTIILSMNVYAGAWSQTVNLKLENATLREVFKAVKQQTGVYFVFNEEEIADDHRLTMEVNDASLESAMSQILKGLPYSFECLEGMVVIKPMPQKDEKVKVLLTSSMRHPN